METINDRLEQIINALFNGNKAAFAKSIDLPPTGMSNYIGNKRRSIPSSEIASKIVLVLGVDANWLLTGEGEMMKGAPAKQSIVVGDLNHVEGPVSVSQSTTKPEPADSAVLRARLTAAEDVVQALRAQLLEKEQTAAALRQIIEEKQKLINLLEAR